MSGTSERVDFFTGNNNQDIGLATFSGYMGFVGEVSARYGGTPRKTIGLTFSIVGET